MPCRSSLIGRVLAVAFASAFIAVPAFADPPDGPQKHRRKGHGSGQPDQREEQRGDHRGRGDDRRGDRHERHFADNHRTIVHEYYRESWRSGHCPPGLARKHNGCLPPGQARRWEYGRRLPREVIFYDVPPALVVQLGVPRPGHRYVRVGADILMIAIGTAIVVDAIEGFGD